MIFPLLHVSEVEVVCKKHVNIASEKCKQWRKHCKFFRAKGYDHGSDM